MHSVSEIYIELGRLACVTDLAFRSHNPTTVYPVCGDLIVVLDRNRNPTYLWLLRTPTERIVGLGSIAVRANAEGEKSRHKWNSK